MKLTDSLQKILEIGKTRALTLGEVMNLAGFQGQVVFLILLVTPMLQPIPLPGISSVLSILTVMIGYQILTDKPAWIPDRFKNRVISTEKLQKWIEGGIHIVTRVERICRPRTRFGGKKRWMKRTVAVVIVLTSLLLALPLPIPLSNFFPSATIFLLGIGLLEDDALFYIFGFVFFCISAAYIGTILKLPFYLMQA